MATFLQQVVNGLSLGSVYALIAVGYSLVYSILLFSNFAHGGFLVVGGYAAYGMLNAMGMNVWAPARARSSPRESSPSSPSAWPTARSASARRPRCIY